MLSLEQNADWLLEQRNHEVQRLQGILRNPRATELDKSVAQDMLKQYEEEPSGRTNGSH